MLLTILILILVVTMLLAIGIFTYDQIVVGELPTICLDSNTTRKILKQLDLKPRQVVYDLGCGNGRVLVEAARLQPGAKFIGIEKANLALIRAKYNTKNYKNISIVRGDILKANIENADVVFLYLIPSVISKLKPVIIEAKNRKAKIVSVEYELPFLKPTMTGVLKQPTKLVSKWYLY